LSSTKSLLLAALVLAPLAASAEDAKAPKVTFSGMVDSYYTLNLTHAQDYSVPTNGYSADTGFNLNFAKLTTVAELDPVTFRLDVGLGKEGVLIGNAITSTAPSYPTFVEQAYASMKFGKFTVDAGRFVTPAGFEVFEAKDNWIYSKGLIFNYALPTAHEGVRVGYGLTPELTLTAYLANGGDLFSNDVGSTQSPYKTFILNGVFARDATTLAGTFFITKNPATAQDGYLFDVVFTQGLGKLSINLSGDYGTFSSSGGLPSYSWLALGASAKLQLTDALKVVGRVEYLDDSDGARTGLAPVGASGVNFVSVTAGAGYAVGSNAELKAELRLDKASENAYRSAKDTAATIHLAAIAWF